jgi:sigma-B regulation protein RsbU (phosphoserine phosphatase)
MAAAPRHDPGRPARAPATRQHAGVMTQQATADPSEDDARHQLLFETCPLGLVVVDASGRIADANPAFAALSGRPRHAARSLQLGDVFLGLVAASLSRDRPSAATCLHADGRRIPVLVRQASLQHGGGALLTLEELDGQGGSGLALRELARFAEEDPNPLLRVGPDLHLIYANEAGAAVLEAWGTRVGGRVPDALAPVIRRALQASACCEVELASGPLLHAWQASPGADGAHVNLRGRDVTEARRAEHRLAEAREQEIAIGAKIQELFLHGQPPRDMPGLRIDAITIPSQRLDGDFCDFIAHGRRCVDVLIGDVMGKGLPAALLGAATKSRFVRALGRLVSAAEGQLPAPVEVVGVVHEQVSSLLMGLESFVTVCYARFDLVKRRVDFVDCGHPKTIHYRRRTGACSTLHGNDLPLGFRERHVYHQRSVTFEPGDLFVMYSDGLTEARSPSGDLFGEERLVTVVREHGDLEAAALFERVRAAVAAFTGTHALADDVTFIALTFEPVETDAPLAHRQLVIGSDLADLARGREFVRAFCRDVLPADADPRVAEELELAVQEAASNIVKHAYGGRADQAIWISADAHADRLAVRLSHEGAAFEPAKAHLPDLEGYPERGFGLYLIERCVDAISFARDAYDRSSILLVKKLGLPVRDGLLHPSRRP